MEIIERKFYGYKITQNPSKPKLSLYMGGIDAQILRDIVSVDNAVGWDVASKLWKAGGRNRVIIESHWQSIRDFLSSSNQERMLPSAIVISVEESAFKFEPFAQMPEMAYVTPGMITIKGRFETPTGGGTPEPVEEKNRAAWVLDGQHRIKAFRSWSMPDPYPVNVTIIKAWSGDDYEDVMRHQTYELNMGRPLSDDFKAAVREQYDRQVGHKDYKRQIALSWIRKDLEDRGEVFSPNGVVGAAGLRPNHVITMSLLEKVIQTAFDHDPYLAQTYTLEKMDKNEVSEVSEYLFNFFEGVRLSIGLLNPNTKGTIGTEPEVSAAIDYWDIALKTKHKQRLLHNVGLKALVRGLLNPVMRSSNPPKTPQEVAAMLDHMRGIPWHNQDFQSKKDDWVGPLAVALGQMYRGKGTAKGKKYQLLLEKHGASGNVIDTFGIEAYGW
jgi:DGQHR domain-containing protein